MKKIIFTIALFSTCSIGMNAQEIIELWPFQVPDQIIEKSVAKSETKGGVTRLSNVTNPIVKVYKPSNKKDNKNSIVVCPGGGYNILAIDLEGSEVAMWLSSIGYTVYVLEYRVPQQRNGALQDVQRALRTARSKSVSPNSKVGVLGFSAGGHLSASASTRYDEKVYDINDEFENASARPDFAILIYPAYLDKGENGKLSPEITLSEQTPPMFIFQTADDPYANSAIVMGQALRDNKTSVELHLLPEGGHGYGLRNEKEAGRTWPILLEKWLNKQIK